MFNAFTKGVLQLSDPFTRKYLWLGAAASVAAFLGLWMVVWYLLSATGLFETGWLEIVVDILGGLAALVLTWFLFPAVVSAVIGLFLEDIATAVEARHYPELPPASGLPLAAAIKTTLSYLSALIVINVLLLPFLLIPPVFPFVFYAANGYLLSREYFELVALRRIGPDEARTLRKAHRGQLFLAGVVIAVLLTVPGVNLLAPVVATAAMVHLFEDWRREQTRR